MGLSVQQWWEREIPFWRSTRKGAENADNVMRYGVFVAWKKGSLREIRLKTEDWFG